MLRLFKNAKGMELLYMFYVKKVLCVLPGYQHNTSHPLTTILYLEHSIYSFLEQRICIFSIVFVSVSIFALIFKVEFQQSSL